MIARVSLEIALRKEFDYTIPLELVGRVDVGSRVQVPFGARKVLGVVTAMAEESAHTKLKPMIKVIGAQTLVTPKVLKLARWMAGYYCCAPEIALKSVLPEAVRKEDAGWRERLFVRVLPASGEFPKLPQRQQEVWNVIKERRELPLAELLELTETTAATVRPRGDFADATAGVESKSGGSAGRDHGGDGEPEVRSQKPAVRSRPFDL
jgi:primosomal protein N' (replication factor Y)